MTFDWWLTYLITTTILSLTPGSGAINTMSTTIAYGFRGAVPAIFGLQTGLTIHIVLVGFGLGALFSQSVLAFEILKWLGAGYLIWLGIQQWRSSGALDLGTINQALPGHRLFKRAIFVNLTNPKSIVFLAALFPQFIIAGQPKAEQLAILGLTTVVVDIIVMAGYAMLASHIAHWIRSPVQMKLLNRIFGSLFIAIAALLITARRT